MSLFQTSVQKNYLNLQDKAAVTRAFNKFKKYFHSTAIQQNIRESKEEQFQQKFLMELFVNILDYTIFPDKDYNLTTEFKNEKGAQKADGAILKDGKAIAVIELKGTRTKDLEKIRKQAFDYKANQSECVYVVTSNFEKIRFYINDAVNFEEFNLFTLTEEQFELFYLCLHKNNILNNLPLKIKQESIVEEESITKSFYANYSLFKRELYRDLVKENMKNDVFRAELQKEDSEKAAKNIKRTLFKKSQKLIDRFLFIFFAEDRGLLPPNSTLQILNKWNKDVDFGDERPLYDLFKQYFHFLDIGRQGTTSRAEIFAYNGGLFKPDATLDSLIIDDQLLFKHTKTLSDYNFASQIDVNILGHIFENSLNEIESVNAEIDGVSFDKQTTKRKKDGVYYTPKYITKYIVDNTVGKLCADKKIELGIEEDEYFKSRKGRTTKKLQELRQKLNDYRNWMLTLTILDPACGSGAFLNQALDFLINEHEYIDELNASLLGVPMVLSDIENTVLEKNIYGVDINEESVEIAKLSLWLRTAQPRRKLNILTNNIKCGNSLIDSKAAAGDKAFIWEEEFPEVFDKGGFDVIIGNPPWGAKIEKSQKDYIINKYTSKKGEIETYVHFIDLSINSLAKDNGMVGLITPSTWYYLDKYVEIRNSVLQRRIEILIELEKRIFEDAPDIVPAVFILRNSSNINKEVRTFKLKKNNIPKYMIDNSIFTESIVNISYWEDLENIPFNLLLSKEKMRIISKMSKNDKLKKLFNVRYGIKTGNNKLYVTKTIEKRDENWKYCIPAASCVKKYALNWDGDFLNYGEHLAGFSKNSFENPKILIQYIRKLSMENRLICALDMDGYYYPLNNFSFIEERKDSYLSLKYLLGILNSNLLNFYFKNVFIDYNIKPKYIEKLPIAFTKNSNIFETKVVTVINGKVEISKLRNNFLQLFQSRYELPNISKKLTNWFELDFKEFLLELAKIKLKLSLSDESEWMQFFNEQKEKVQDIKTRVEKIEEEINQMVYELYGLTQAEIKIVEESKK